MSVPSELRGLILCAARGFGLGSPCSAVAMVPGQLVGAVDGLELADFFHVVRWVRWGLVGVPLALVAVVGG
eukprot:9394176-Heterocapsa_arctica.AAC.1